MTKCSKCNARIILATDGAGDAYAYDAMPAGEGDVLVSPKGIYHGGDIGEILTLTNHTSVFVRHEKTCEAITRRGLLENSAIK